MFQLVRNGDESLHLFLKNGDGLKAEGQLEEGEISKEEGEVTSSGDEPVVILKTKSAPKGHMTTLLDKIFHVAFEEEKLKQQEMSESPEFTGTASEWTMTNQETVDPEIQEALFALQIYIGDEYYPKCLKKLQEPPLYRQTITSLRFGIGKTVQQDAEESTSGPPRVLKDKSITDVDFIPEEDELAKCLGVDSEVICEREYDHLQFPFLFSDMFIEGLQAERMLMFRFISGSVQESLSAAQKASLSPEAVRLMNIQKLKQFVSNSLPVQIKTVDEYYYIRALLHFAHCGLPLSPKNCLCEICGRFRCPKTHGGKCWDLRCMLCFKRGHTHSRCYSPSVDWRVNNLYPMEQSYRNSLEQQGNACVECIDCAKTGHVSCSEVMHPGKDKTRFDMKKNPTIAASQARPGGRSPKRTSSMVCAGSCDLYAPKRYAYFDAYLFTPNGQSYDSHATSSGGYYASSSRPSDDRRGGYADERKRPYAHPPPPPPMHLPSRSSTPNSDYSRSHIKLPESKRWRRE